MRPKRTSPGLVDGSWCTCPLGNPCAFDPCATRSARKPRTIAPTGVRRRLARPADPGGDDAAYARAVDDASLVVAARSGDRDAFAAIYDRYADRLYDHCRSILREPAEAADAMQDTFVVAVQRLDQLRSPEKVRPWLYAIARHESLRRVKARARAEPTDDLTSVAAEATSPEDDVSTAESTELVWAASAGLAERDRAILDLHLRHGLDGQELADALGTSPNQAYVLMSRLRDRVERSLGALLIARLGRDDCLDLAELLHDWDGHFTVQLRKRVARHVDRCEICDERRKQLVSPLALLSAMPLAPAPLVLRESTLERMGSAAAGSHAAVVAADSARWQRNGFPPPVAAPPGRRARRIAAIAAVLGALLLAASVVLWPGSDATSIASSDDQAARTTTPGSENPGGASSNSGDVGDEATELGLLSGSEVAPTSARAGVAGQEGTATPDPAGVGPTGDAPPQDPPAGPAPTAAPPTASPQPTEPSTQGASTTTVPSTTVPPTTSPPTTAPPDAPPTVSINSVSASEIWDQTSFGQCNPKVSTIIAPASDDVGVTQVVLDWSGAELGSGSQTMTEINGVWFGSVGPYASVSLTDLLTITVTATDTIGQTSVDVTSVLVKRCIG